MPDWRFCHCLSASLEGIAFVKSEVVLPSTHEQFRPPPCPLVVPALFLDAAAQGVKCQVAAGQPIDIIQHTVKLSLDNP
jgi:hypothetical protein